MRNKECIHERERERGRLRVRGRQRRDKLRECR